MVQPIKFHPMRLKEYANEIKEEYTIEHCQIIAQLMCYINKMKHNPKRQEAISVHPDLQFGERSQEVWRPWLASCIQRNEAVARSHCI
jgi:hypothetical protein